MDFEVSRSDLHQCRVVDQPPPVLEPGQALLRVDAFALTANNITYALMGEALQYWTFFPSHEPELWGRIPVWGFADVIATTHDAVAEGTRVYGYLPMSTYLAVAPDRVDERGFVDAAPHRRALPSAYNRYAATAADPLHDPEREDHRMLLFPLFFTSFLIEDFLDDHSYFGADTVIVSSASSKTAIGTAFELDRRGAVEVVGLTSLANEGFVAGLGIYDRVVTYDGIGSLPVTVAAYVDIAGNAAVRDAVHRHCADQLVHSMAVGATHWDQPSPDADENAGDLPGARPTFFFAPDQITKRAHDWGPAGLGERVAPAWNRFVEFSDGWLRIEHGHGPEAVERVFRGLLEGRTDPATGHVLSLWPPNPT